MGGLAPKWVAFFQNAKNKNPYPRDIFYRHNFEKPQIFPKFVIKLKSPSKITLDFRERYINFYTDFAFKRLFGSEVNKDLLLSFLNALLNGEEEITEIQYLNSEKLGTLEIDRKAVFDVYCKTNKDEFLIVEMRKGEQQFFKDRSVFYSTFPIREQAQKGNWEYQLKGVYTIGILNFCFDNTDPNYFHHEVMDTQTKEVFYDKLTYVYLDMPKFNKSLDELNTIFDKWLYVMRHLSELLEKPKIMEEEIFSRLFEQAEIAHFTKRERMEYEESLKAYRDWYSVTKTSFDKGVAEGLQKGIEQGREEGLLLVAKRLKTKGLSLEEIAKITSLPLPKLESL